MAKHVNIEFAVGLVGFLVLSIACAIYAGAGAGLRHREARVSLASSGTAADHEQPVEGARLPTWRFSTESADYVRAARAFGIKADELFEECRDDPNVAIVVRAHALELWLERQADAHHLAQRKDRAVGMAGIMLGFALICGAVMVIVILAH